MILRSSHPRFSFPIPFDPFRLLLAGMEKAPRILSAGFLVSVAGGLFGMVYLGDSYEAPVRLSKESAPLFWNPEASDPYRPRPLSGEALEIVATSPAVYERAGQLAGGIPFEAIENMVEFKNSAGEDLYEIFAHSKKSREHALELSAAYARAIIEETSEKRREEAVGAAAVFRTQLNHRREAVSAVGARLKANSSEQQGLLSGVHLDGHLNELQDLRHRMSENRIALKSKKENLEGYLRETILSPLQQELELLRVSRTDAHHEVRQKLAEIKQLESQLSDIATGKARVESLSTKVAPVLFTQALNLRDEIRTLEISLGEYERLVGLADAETTSLSDSAINTADVRLSFEREVGNTAMIESRLKDAEFYASEESGSPVTVFAVPHLADVNVKTRWFKAAILGGLGLVGGAGAVLLVILLKELTVKKVRTPLQAAIAAGTLPKFVFSGSGRGRTDLHDFVVSCVLKYLPRHRFVFPVIGKVAGETRFWEKLLEALSGGNGRQRAVFADVSNAPLVLMPDGRDLPDYDPAIDAQRVSRIDIANLTGDNFGNFARTLPGDTILLVRWDTDPDATLASLAGELDHSYLLASPESTTVAELEDLSHVYEELLGTPEGMVLVQEHEPGLAGRIVSEIERWFMQFQSQRAPIFSPPSLSPVPSTSEKGLSRA